MPRFSIITPVNLWNQERVDKFLKCIQSVRDQNFRDFEWVIINDGSSMDFDWKALVQDPALARINIVVRPHGERVIAYNHGFAVAQGDWFTFLDSDDEYSPRYLTKVDQLISDYPKNKIFNFGCCYAEEDNKFTFRDPFKPKKLRRGHEVFGGGTIPNGCFVFHRSIYDELGGFPGGLDGLIKQVDCTEINYPEYLNQEKPYIRDLFMNTPFNFSAAAQLEFPEIRQYYMVDHEAEPEKILKELGNPWGQDYYLFYKYTRKYHSKPVKDYLYIVHGR